MNQTHANPPTHSAEKTDTNQVQQVSRHLSFLNLYRLYRQLLPRAERRVLWLVEVRGASYSDIAKVLGVHRSVVASLAFHGRRQLFLRMEGSLRELARSPTT